MTQQLDLARSAAAPSPPQDGDAAAGRVVVGVDDGPSSVAALRWALGVARRHGWMVDVVTAWPDREAVFVREVPGHHSDHRHRAVMSQRRALAAVVEDGSPVPTLRTFVENDRPAHALAAHSSGASLVVVGASRPGAAESTAVTVSESGDCPVVVVDPARPARASARA
jgi:hypothetical protein